MGSNDTSEIANDSYVSTTHYASTENFFDPTHPGDNCTELDSHQIISLNYSETTNRTFSFETSPSNVTNVRDFTVTPLEIVLCVVLSAFIVATIVGNVFVILAVALFDKMRTMSNVLIASLASADLLVAIVVLPISLQKEVVGHWTLGKSSCYNKRR